VNDEALQAIAIASAYIETVGLPVSGGSQASSDRYQFAYLGIDSHTGHHIVRATHDSDTDTSTPPTKGSTLQLSFDLLVDLDARAVSDVLMMQ
jgi:hypothetical protein